MHLRNWPLYDLAIRTPRLEIRLPDLAELDALGTLAAEGVHDPEVMPFLVPWTDAPPEERARSTLQNHWKNLAQWSPDSWTLPLAVFHDGRIVGLQDMGARSFSVVREVSTGSWLGLPHQGRGFGREMRAAVLALAFDHLGAESARSYAMTDNTASITVSEKVGYRTDGIARITVRDRLVHEQRFVMSRADWQRNRPADVEVQGLEPCLPMFGLTP